MTDCYHVCSSAFMKIISQLDRALCLVIVVDQDHLYKGLCRAICYLFNKPKLQFPKIMIQFCNYRWQGEPAILISRAWLYWKMGLNLRASPPGLLWQRGGKRKESLQLHTWNLNSSLASCWLSCQISANQCEAEPHAKSSDIITNVISTNQHFALTFSIQIFKFQRHSSKLFFLFLLHCQSAPESLLAV